MTNWIQTTSIPMSTGLWIFMLALGLVGKCADAAETTVPVTFSGGHETDRRDGGRPVVLVAAGLGVKPEVFREAFSNVTPAHDGKPSPELARRNKEVLMKVLKPLGITNDRLDEVSNYYRYQPQKGQLWTTTPAKAEAIVEDGQIKKLVVTEAGSGYSSPPKATVQGLETIQLKVTLRFCEELKKNGSISSIEVDSATPAGASR